VPLETHNPEVKEVISVDVARQMMILLQAVTHYGTGAAAASLNHPLGGKTGTTNDYTDAWFVGFSPSVTCGTWIGFDDRQSLGEKETGARAALPMWMDFMRAAIAGKDDEAFPTANAPKKVLAVPLSAGTPPKQPDAGDVDPDDPDGGVKLPPAPAAPAPPPTIPAAPPVAAPPADL
jgi:penicillin-binding protein 1A